jgi:putative DNA primase/helicase
MIQLREQRRADYCTKATTVDPDLTADCPLWKAFLLRIMRGNQSMVDYLQRVSGYCCTGITTEHVMFFCHGTGANGKGTFVGVLLGILGTGASGYAAVAPISTFTASRTEQHPTDLAMLRAARLVVAQETEQGRTWAMSKIKMMTGGDMISARFMRQDFFTYSPQFKVMILGNHKPALNTVDEATRRRIHLIPFTVTIPKARRDPQLAEKLRAEYPAILAWMLRGCEQWQEIGLAPPRKVAAAAAAYFADEDTIGTWLSDCCELGNTTAHYATLTDLYPSYRSWCEDHGEEVGASRALARELDARPELTRRKQPKTNRAGWKGLRLAPAAAARAR